MIELKGTEQYVILTDAIKSFHFTKLSKDLICKSGQPYAILDDDYYSLFEKVFIEPYTNRDVEEYNINELTQKTEQEIISNSDIINTEV